MVIRHKVAIDFARYVPIEIDVTKNNQNTVILEMFFLENGNYIDMSEIAIVSFKAETPMGNIIFNDISDIRIDHVEYAVSENVMAVSGRTVCTVQVYGYDEHLINSFEFYINVYPSLYDEETLISENDLSGFRSYMLRAQMAAERSEDTKRLFDLTYGNFQKVVGSMNEIKSEYELYLEQLQDKVNSGQLNGSRGPAGENGANGIVVEAKGMIGFQIKEGNLYCFYYADEVPDMVINENGELVFVYGEE